MRKKRSTGTLEELSKMDGFNELTKAELEEALKFIQIMVDCNMGDDPEKNALASLIHVEGIRLHGASAKKLGFDTKKGAYFCLWETILDWEEAIGMDESVLGQKQRRRRNS